MRRNRKISKRNYISNYHNSIEIFQRILLTVDEMLGVPPALMNVDRQIGKSRNVSKRC